MKNLFSKTLNRGLAVLVALMLAVSGIPLAAFAEAEPDDNAYATSGVTISGTEDELDSEQPDGEPNEDEPPATLGNTGGLLTENGGDGETCVCTAFQSDADCTVCGDDATQCFFYYCICEALCGEDSINADCPICADDYTSCVWAVEVPEIQPLATTGTYDDLKTNAAQTTGDSTITLTDSITGDTQLTIARTLTLDLNGKNLTIDLDATTGETSNGIKIASGVTLTITDNGSNGKLTVTNRASGAQTGSGAGINVTEGTLIINGGTVEAKGGGVSDGGGAGAGIGGGSKGASGTITINGTATVTSTGGGSVSAGIGGGYMAAFDTITIGGNAVVTANGGSGGAGIGSGKEPNNSSGNATEIIIKENAKVYASSTEFGAGIGGGLWGKGGTVTITDAQVEARAGSFGTGTKAIGMGSDGHINGGSNGTVTVTGTYSYIINEIKNSGTDANAIKSGGTFTDDGTTFAEQKYVKLMSPIYDISLTPATNKIFGTETAGYAAPTPHSVTIKNTGNMPTGALSIALSGTNADSFTLSETSMSSLALSGSDIFTVAPITGLTAGTYNATVTVSGGNGITKSFTVSFAVSAPPASAVISDVTVSGIVGTQLAAGNTATITLTNCTFSALNDGTAVDWFTNKPADITATITGSVVAGASSATVTFSGVPSSTSTNTIAVTIPHNVLSSGAALNVTANPNAQWNIAAAPPPKTVSVGAQNGTLTQGTAGAVTYTVTTANIADGSAITLNNTNAVQGISLTVAVTTSNSTVITVNTTALTPHGTHPLTLTIDGITSSSFDLDVDEAPPPVGKTDAEKVAEDKAALTLANILGDNADKDNITVNLEQPLPSTGENGSIITWSSDNTAVIANDGTVTRPDYAANDANDTEVKLTATITNGTESDTKEFTLTVKQKGQAYADVKPEPGAPKTDADFTGLLADEDSFLQSNPNATVEYTLTVEQKAPPTADASLVAAKLAANEQVLYLDVSLWRDVTGAASGNGTTQIENATSPITITITLPQSLRNKSPYTIIRVHDDGSGATADIITPIYDPALHTLTFTTNKFSTYAIAYKQTSTPNPPNPPTNPPSGNGSSSGGGGTGSAPTAPTQWVDASDAKDMAKSAKEQDADSVRTRSSGEAGIRKKALHELGKSGLIYRHDTIADSTVQVRIYVDEPSKATKDILVSGYTSGTNVDKATAIIKKWYSNDVAVISLDQQGDFGMNVRIAARADLSGLNTSKLYFYSYDKATNKYKLIVTEYRIDSKGYVHFSTVLGGSIIITDRPLTKNGADAEVDDYDIPPATGSLDNPTTGGDGMGMYIPPAKAEPQDFAKAEAIIETVAADGVLTLQSKTAPAAITNNGGVLKINLDAPEDLGILQENNRPNVGLIVGISIAILFISMTLWAVIPRKNDALVQDNERRL